MASLVARQAIGNLRCAKPAYFSRCSARALHLTPVVQKKKNNVVIEDLFADDGVEEVIQPEVPQSSPSSVASTSTLNTSTQKSSSAPKRKGLSPEVRLERLNQIRDFVEPRLGRNPAVKAPLVRNSAWVHLVGLATNEEQLTKVADMFPGWKESGRRFDSKFSELFVRRCEELSCPLLALRVFGDFSKYNLPLTLPGARLLLHSLHVEHPLNTVMTASALYSVYSLTPVAQDLPSCAMVMAACFKHNSKDSLKVANALVPSLEALLDQTKPIKISINSTEKALQKPDVWVQWTLKKVDKALFVKTGKRAEWLHAWRERSGHIAELSTF